MQRPASTSDIDAVLRRLARPQLGLVTLDQLSQAGIDHSAITRRRAAGALEGVFAGVLRLDAAPTTPEQRTLAAALAVPGSAVAASSAALVAGMPVSAPSVPIVAAGQARSARTADIITVRSRFVLPSRPWHTARVATPEATLVMLPRFETDEMVERCLDHCLAHRLTTVERVSDLIGSLPPRAVVGRRLLAALVDARTGMGHRSRVERRVGRWLDAAGLGGWERNHPVPVSGGGPVEVDFAWLDARVVLEVSPFFTHGSRVAQERDAERRRLLVVDGWSTVEATDPHLVDQQSFDVIIRSLRQALAMSCAPEVAERPGSHTTSSRTA